MRLAMPNSNGAVNSSPSGAAVQAAPMATQFAASGSVSQSASGAASISGGSPALWMLGFCALAFFLLHKS